MINDTKRGILDMIANIASEAPDLRVGQIIGNVLPTGFSDPYYINDENLLELLEISYRKLKERRKKEME